MDSEVRLLEFKYRILHLPALRLSADYQVCGLISSYVKWASQVALVVKNLLANARDIGDAGSIPRSGRSPGERNGNLPQYYCLEISWTEEPGRVQPLGLQRVRHD